MPKAKPQRAKAATSERHSPDVRRAMVLKVAARLIADEGLLAVTMRRIADEAQVSLGTLTHHFESQDELLAQALEVASVEFVADLSQVLPNGSALQRLHAIIDAVMPHNEKSLRQWRLWLQFWSRAAYEPALARTHDRRYSTWEDTIAVLIKAGVKEGALSSGLRVNEVAKNLVAFIDGVCLQVVVSGDVKTAAKARATIRRFVSQQLQAHST